MAITDRALTAGTRLEAKYKKQTLTCLVESAEGGGLSFVLPDGRRFKTPSGAGSAAKGGKSCNGYDFWTVAFAGEQTSPEPAKKPPTKTRGRKLVYKVPNQQGVAAGKQKYFCSACMKGFVVDAGETPEACPEGHRTDDPELTAPVGAGSAAE